MLISKDNSALLVVDVQEKLLPAIDQSAQMVDSCAWLVRLASHLGFPYLISEHYIKGLGTTVEQIKSHALDEAVMPSKVHFSCMADSQCRQAIFGIG